MLEMPRADVEPGWSGIGPTALFTAALPAIEGEIGSATFLASLASSGHWGTAEGEMGGMGPTIFLTAALARPRVKYVQQHFSQRPWGRYRGRNGSNNIFNSSAGAAESEIRPATFFAATLGHHRERNGRNGSNNISYSSAGGRWRNRSSNISYSSGGHGQVRVMGRREPEIGPATFFALQLPVSATEGRKSEIGPTPGPGGHCPTGTVTAHLNLEAKEWGAPRFQIRPRQPCSG